MHGWPDRAPRMRCASCPRPTIYPRSAWRTFRAGLRHELVDRKWPAFEEVFDGFDPDRCASTPDERIEELLGDRRLIRNLPKLRAVRANAGAVVALRSEGGIGAWLADWPGSQVMPLWDELARRFQQMGGNSGTLLPAHGRQGQLHADRQRAARPRALGRADRPAAAQGRSRPDPAGVQRLGGRDRPPIVPIESDAGDEPSIPDRQLVRGTRPSSG